MQNAQNEFFESLFEDLKSKSKTPLSNENRKPITIWIPIEYHEKFEKVQKSYGRRFSGKIRQMIMMAIDQVAR